MPDGFANGTAATSHRFLKRPLYGHQDPLVGQGFCAFQTAHQGINRTELGCLHGVSNVQAGRVPARLDGIFRAIGAVSSRTRTRPLAAPQGAYVLLETVALLSYQGSRAHQARHLLACCYLGWIEPERPLEIIPYLGDPFGHDQSMAQGSRFAFYQRFMGKHPLPGYGSVASGNRLVRTRMLGGVGAGGEIPPATRLCLLLFTL